MLRSMTGFGRCLVEDASFVQQWEIKSVNGRHLDLKWRLPVFVRSIEARLEKIVRQHAQRGRIDISLTLQYADTGAWGSMFDVAQATGMLQALDSFATSQGDAFTPDYNTLLSIPNLWIKSEEELDEGTVLRLEEGLALALEDWNEARSAEGAALAADMNSRILRMEEWTDIIAKRAPLIKQERTTTVHDRLADVLAQYGTELDENRFLQEIVVLVDKLDVSEELTRLGAHLSRLHHLLDSGNDAGRRLDFTLQECFREVNTCGNKIQDIQVSRLIVDFKNELEKCREQVQNLE